MAEETEDSSGFKVIDRRPFAADGTPREELSQDEAKEPETAPPPSSARAGTAPSEAPREDFFEENTAGFDTLVSYLSTTAMFQLGLLPGPSGERIPSDLLNARRTIDLLEVLQQKTRGNLTPDEEKLLQDVLYELRMTFVELETRQSKRRK